VPNPGSGPDTVQYGTASSYPVGSPTTYYLSGSDRLVSTLAGVAGGSARFVAPGAVPGSYSETSALQGSAPPAVGKPRDVTGTYAAYNSGTLTQAVDIAGIPTVNLRVSAPSVAVSQAAGPSGQLVLFVKLYDVTSTGKNILVDRLVAPIRVADVTKPFTVTLPGIVHRFPAGHHFELVVAGSDAAYKGNTTPVAVSVVTSRSAPGVLRLPVV
jgi:ABC-2 type transport system ATP-binding protein